MKRLDHWDTLTNKWIYKLICGVLHQEDINAGPILEKLQDLAEISQRIIGVIINGATTMMWSMKHGKPLIWILKL